MTNSHKLTAALAVILAAFLICAGYGFVKEHEANAVLAAQQQSDRAATAALAVQERDNQQQLAATLKTYAEMKQQVQTPAQVVKALPVVINLPSPIVPVTEAQADAANAAALPDAPKLSTGDLIVPAQSVKAFYDAQVDCKSNEARVASLDLTVANDKSVMAVKDSEITQLQTALKGGTKWQRTKHVLKFVGIGAAIGAGATAYLITK